LSVRSITQGQVPLFPTRNNLASCTTICHVNLSKNSFFNRHENSLLRYFSKASAKVRTFF
ncbi:hypothetical protein VPJ68_10680, partial [Parabacteroides distasonis]